MSYWKDYRYVDAHYEHKTKKRRMPWVRLQVSHVSDRIVAKAGGSNCFTTIQRFKDATSLLEQSRSGKKVKRKVRSEKAEREDRIKEGDLLPEQQSHYHGLFFDFDCDYKKFNISEDVALDRSKSDATNLVEWFLATFDLSEAHIQVWFSGKKGFHVLVRPEPFGMRPHNHLTYIVRNIAYELADRLEMATMDRSVYSSRRMWRIPNTVHQSTGRFKIELSVQELKNWSVSKILEESRAPRHETENRDNMAVSHIWPRIEYQGILVDEVAADWYQERCEHYDAYRDLKNLRPRKSILTFEDAGENYPACIKDLIDNGPKDGGPNRNRVILPLAGFMYDAGLEKIESHKVISDWTRNFYPDERYLQDRLSNGKSVVESAYRGQVRFSCRFIRSCNGPGEKGRVKCDTEAKCRWIQNPQDQELAQVPMIHLSEADRGCYNGTKIRTAVHVATIAGRPFQLPLAGKILCNPDPDAKICENCPNNGSQGNGKLQWTFDAESRHVLNLVNVNDNIKKGTIKAKCGVPQKCYRCHIEVDEHTNLEEIQLIPMVDYAQAYQMGSGQASREEDTAVKSPKHVVSLAYHMGHGIEANKKYIIEPTVFGHPRDQRACFLFDKLEAAQNDIDHFKMTPELRQKLKVFQVKRGQTVEQKMLEIHRDFTVNVHRIGGRFDLSIAVDLCYHSVIGFQFAGSTVNKGWFELVVMGDTATGKTTLIEGMMRHFGLGELIAGEDAKRTGLIYASVQLQGQWVLIWGKIPQNDRRLLVIDEFSGIPTDEISKMTQLRSEGKARGGGVNSHYETFARTRMIFLTNPRGNHGSLQGFNYGVQSISQLFEHSADFRRVDLAIVCEQDEVESRLMTRRWDKISLPHVYTADLCRNLVLWAWSRDPQHVEWDEGAEDEVITWADRLGDTYECDLPLAIRADLKHKIARISCAVAARLFSTDKEAKKVVVKKEHIQFAARLMDRIYRKDSMSYFEYARQYKQDNYFSQEKRKKIESLFNSFIEDRDGIIKALLDVDYLTKPMLVDMVNMDADDLKRMWRFFVHERLLKKVSRGYRKTGAFTKLLKQIGSRGSSYTGDLSDDFESGGDFAVPDGGDVVRREKPETAPVHEEPAGAFEDTGYSSVDEPPF